MALRTRANQSPRLLPLADHTAQMLAPYSKSALSILTRTNGPSRLDSRPRVISSTGRMPRVKASYSASLSATILYLQLIQGDIRATGFGDAGISLLTKSLLTTTSSKSDKSTTFPSAPSRSPTSNGQLSITTMK
jgi:hypothetical protein